jgi:hypothetical protein
MRLHSFAPVLAAGLILPAAVITPPEGAGGPGTISAAPAYTTSGNKTVIVNPNTVAANYDVWTRECVTGDTSSCSEDWVLRLDTYDQTGIAKHVVVYVNVDNAEDCESYGPTFQVKFTSSGFGTPVNTVYHTADICYPLAD